MSKCISCSVRVNTVWQYFCFSFVTCERGTIVYWITYEIRILTASHGFLKNDLKNYVQYPIYSLITYWSYRLSKGFLKFALLFRIMLNALNAISHISFTEME